MDMKTLYGTLLVGACLLVSSCRQGTESGMLTLTLDSAGLISPDKEMPLETLGMRVEAIPLETTDSCLVKDISCVEESRDFYWLVFDGRVAKFDKTGHFLQYIGACGQGPGEYVSAYVIQPVEALQHLYVMDFFGRKMNVYDFDGGFIRSFKLPDETWMDTFRYKDGKVYYQTTGNSVMPDIYSYDVQTERMDTLCKRERDMGTEGYIGKSVLYTLDGDLFTYHYFNDTVYRLEADRMEPAWLFRTGKMTWTYDEVTLMADFSPKVRPDGPRVQLFDLFETERYCFVFYTLSEYKGEKMKPFMALYDKKQARFYPHLNLISPDAPWLSVKEGGRLFRTSVSGSLYAVKEAADLFDKKGFEEIKEDDNPVLLRYVYQE